MARITYLNGGATQNPATNTGTPPAAPTSAVGAPAANVASLPGCRSLIIDTDLASGAAATLTVWVWNPAAQEWFTWGSPITATTNAKTRTVIDDLAAQFVFVQSASVSGTVKVWVGGILEVGY